ncbi:EF hand family protein, related [Eimeria praecox]|uniref:EF hand family protein, related n=1 Tax=Eimeria praecox TaxID=51316 RepID=U6G3P2_9EIME|nr:EF hand family protein, related [Eimeria praecox]
MSSAVSQKLQFQWEAGDINERSPRKSDAGNAGVVVTVQKTAVSYSYGLTYIKAVPYNWVEYAHRALLWQVKKGGETFCSDTWGSKWLRFGKIPDPYLTKFCPVVEYPWYRMLKVSENRTWFFKVHVGISWWRPPSPSSLSDEEYKAECSKKISEGSYPKNFDCSQRLHTEAGMADAILELSDATKVARDTTFDVTARLISSDMPDAPEGCSDSDDLAAWGVSETDNPDLARLCKSGSTPCSPFCNPKSCLRHMIVLDEKDVTVDGATCDLPGVSLQQWGRDGFCDYSPGSCFAKNLKWFQAYNEEVAKTGRTPPYALEYPPGNYPRYHAGLENANEAIDTSKAGPFELHRLAFAYPESHKSKVRIEMNAGLIRWIQSSAPGQITSIAPPAPRECDNAQTFGCPLKVYVLNSGSVDATFYLELPYCTEHGSDEPTDKLDPVSAVQRNVPAGSSQAFDLTLRLTAVVQEFDFNCVMKLYDSELNQLDIKSFDLLTGKAAVSLEPDLPTAVTNPTGEVTVVEPPEDKRNWFQRLMNVVPNDGECDCSFWNVICLPADWNDCFGSLKKALKIILLAGITLVALFLLWPVLKPLLKIVCKCASIPFKCLRSAGRHRKTLRKAKKLRKKEAKKLEKEQRRMQQKALEASQRRGSGSYSEEPDESQSSAAQGSESAVSSEVASSEAYATEGRRQASNEEFTDADNSSSTNDDGSKTHYNAQRTKVEELRAALAHRPAFAAHKAFAALDPLGNGCLTSGDLQRYLRNHGIAVTDSEAYNLLRRLDANGDGRVSFPEFVDFLLPAEPSEGELLLSRDQRSPQLPSRSAVACYCCCCCCADKKECACICSGGDACVAQLLHREVDAHRALEVRRRILAACPDFMLLAAFQFLEEPSMAAITPLSLQEALAEEGFALTHMEQKLIFRRFDRDGDGRLKYLEFVEAVMPSNYPSSRSCSDPLASGPHLCVCSLEASPIDCCSHSAAFSGSTRLTRRPKCSMLRSSSSNSSLLRRPVLQPRKGCSCSASLRSFWNRSSSSTESDDSLLLSGTSSTKRNSRFVASECEVAGVLNSQIDTERRLECLREKLALKSDFNLLQFWGLFDTEGRGYATAVHIQDAFNAVGLNISLTQARLFAGKLNSDSEPRLRYADMAKAFLPTKARYAEAMINRTSNGSHKCSAPLTHLAPETLDIVAAIFDLTLASEEQAELSRHRLCLKDLSAAFRDLDKNGDGYITAAEFSASLMAHGFRPSEAELNALVNRYDKNGDSKVSYAEFVNEIGRTRCPVGCCRLICLCR